MSSVEAAGRYRWLWNRLRCMSPAEVVHRATYAAQQRWRPAHRPQAIDRDASAACDDLPAGIAPGAYVAEAQRILAGSVQLFSSSRYEVGAPPAWHRCPLTGVTGPSVPAATIAITDRQRVGDIKYVWELNRHLHWVTLAQAARLTGEAVYVEALQDQVESWLAQCPPGIGPNWTSSLELAIRLINWALVWRLCGDERGLFAGARGQALRTAWLASIEMHVHGIVRHYSRHSSANNHLIGELAGVYIASCQWPCWPAVRALGDQALGELQREAVLQIGRDGVGLEQAFAYQAFVAEFLVATAVTARRSGDALAPAYAERLAGLMCFVRALRARGGLVPNVGDADDAEVLRTDPAPGKGRYDVMLQVGARLFGRDDWLAPDMVARDDAAWLVPQAQRGALRSDRRPVQDHPDGGYWLFGADAGGSHEVKGLFDAGPLGYLGIAAHGHADALQLWLAVGGHELFIDPGTYAYWCPLPWREYFRGTAAHNTVRVGEVEQSESGGRFMWVSKARSQVHAVSRSPDGSFSVVASHDGYRRLPGRFVHRRELRFDGRGTHVEVDDLVEGRSDETIELHWHVAPQWQATLRDGTLTLRLPGIAVTVAVQADVPGELDWVSGQEDPPLGWMSTAYQEKQPSPVLRWRGRAARAQLRTVVNIEHEDGAC